MGSVAERRRSACATGAAGWKKPARKPSPSSPLPSAALREHIDGARKDSIRLAASPPFPTPIPIPIPTHTRLRAATTALEISPTDDRFLLIPPPPS
jgi:hypothetical protein